MLHRREVVVTWRLAARAPDLQPREAPFTAWSIVGGGSIGFAVGTHRLVAAFAKKLVRLLDHRLAIGSHLLDEAAGMLAMARALAEEGRIRSCSRRRRPVRGFSG